MIDLPTETEPVKVVEGDALSVLRRLPAGCVDAVVTDPPAGIAFMGKAWDRDKGGRREWVAWLAGILAECHRVTKPGGRLLCWSIPRTNHWAGTAVEDAGWVIEDVISHLFGTGFPKADSKLKPAREDWWLARKSGKGVPPLNVDACRVGTDGPRPHREKVWNGLDTGVYGSGRNTTKAEGATTLGRWPANVAHDGSEEVLAAFAAFGERTSGKASADGHRRNQPAREEGIYGGGKGLFLEAGPAGTLYGDSGSVARFFYCAKASRKERGGSKHPTVKPLALMQWLVRLVTAPGDLVLDPFAGSGTTGVAALAEGRRALLVEREAGYVADIHRRVAEALGTGLLA